MAETRPQFSKVQMDIKDLQRRLDEQAHYVDSVRRDFLRRIERLEADVQALKTLLELQGGPRG
jgi:hypothetical protein